MAMVMASWTTPQTNLTLVAASTGKIIAVKKVIFNSEQQGWFQLVNDPAGTPTEMTPQWHISAKREMQFEMRREFALLTPAGVALGISTNTSTSPATHSVMLWYELLLS